VTNCETGIMSLVDVTCKDRWRHKSYPLFRV